MATYNGAPFIIDQLKSFANQTLPPDELIICDDGSNDLTIDLIQDFCREAQFVVRLYRNELRLGYARNFFKAISLCTGDIIALSDQDDIWLPGKLKTISEAFDAPQTLLVSHDFSVFFDDGSDEMRSYFKHLQSNGYHPAVNIKGCSIAFRKSLYDRYSFYDFSEYISHDYALCLSASMAGGRKYINEILMRHRIHQKNTSGVLFRSSSPIVSCLKKLLTYPRSEHEEIEYLLWAGTTARTVDAVDRLIGRSGEIACCGTNSVPEGVLYTARSAASDWYLKPSYRVSGVVGQCFRGWYRGRGAPVAFVKDILGRRSG